MLGSFWSWALEEQRGSEGGEYSKDGRLAGIVGQRWSEGGQLAGVRGQPWTEGGQSMSCSWDGAQRAPNRHHVTRKRAGLDWNRGETTGWWRGEWRGQGERCRRGEIQKLGEEC